MYSRLVGLSLLISTALLLCVFCLLAAPPARAAPAVDAVLAGTCIDQIRNGSFASGLSYWTVGGSPSVQGGSAVLGGSNNDFDELSQSIPCPYYGEKVVVHASILMTTTDWQPFSDWLQMSAYGSSGGSESTYYYNNDPQGTWWQWTYTAAGVPACDPGGSWTVRFHAETDAYLPTLFLVDNVSLEVCCPDDPFEPNDSFGNARLVSPGTHDAWLCPNGDEDWFQFSAAAGQTIVVDLSPAGGLQGDICLYRPDGSHAACSANPSPSAPEHIALVADRTGSWRVRVYAPTGGTSTAASRLQIAVGAIGGSVAASATASNPTPAIGGPTSVTINIDMSGVSPSGTALGSFSGSLEWDPAVLQYTANSGLLAGFGGVVNVNQASSGHIAFNGVNAPGATGNIAVLSIGFVAVGQGTSPLDLEFSAMATAGSFANLLPLLSVTDGHVVVAAPQYNLTVTVNPAGSGTTNPPEGVHTYPAGTLVNVTAAASPGYAFAYWSGDCTGAGACSVTMNADRAVTANFVSSSPSATPTRTRSPTPTATGQPPATPTRTCTRTATPPGGTPERLYLPVVLKARCASDDDEFNSAAWTACWSWVNQDARLWSLTQRPGYLRLWTHSGGVGDKNLLLQTLPAGSFDATTRVSIAPTHNYQGAGIVVYGGPGNYLYLTHAYCIPTQPQCVGDGIYFDHVESGGAVGSNFGTPAPAGAGELLLRVERVGNAYSAYYRTDSSAWTLVGSHTLGFTPWGVGLTAASDLSGSSIPADFDYFLLDTIN